MSDLESQAKRLNKHLVIRRPSVAGKSGTFEYTYRTSPRAIQAAGDKVSARPKKLDLPGEPMVLPMRTQANRKTYYGLPNKMWLYLGHSGLEAAIVSPVEDELVGATTWEELVELPRVTIASNDRPLNLTPLTGLTRVNQSHRATDSPIPTRTINDDDDDREEMILSDSSDEDVIVTRSLTRPRGQRRRFASCSDIDENSSSQTIESPRSELPQPSTSGWMPQRAITETAPESIETIEQPFRHPILTQELANSSGLSGDGRRDEESRRDQEKKDREVERERRKEERRRERIEREEREEAEIKEREDREEREKEEKEREERETERAMADLVHLASQNEPGPEQNQTDPRCVPIPNLGPPITINDLVPLTTCTSQALLSDRVRAMGKMLAEIENLKTVRLKHVNEIIDGRPPVIPIAKSFQCPSLERVASTGLVDRLNDQMMACAMSCSRLLIEAEEMAELEARAEVTRMMENWAPTQQELYAMKSIKEARLSRKHEYDPDKPKAKGKLVFFDSVKPGERSFKPHESASKALTSGHKIAGKKAPKEAPEAPGVTEKAASKTKKKVNANAGADQTNNKKGTSKKSGVKRKRKTTDDLNGTAVVQPVREANSAPIRPVAPNRPSVAPNQAKKSNQRTPSNGQTQPARTPVAPIRTPAAPNRAPTAPNGPRMNKNGVQSGNGGGPRTASAPTARFQVQGQQWRQNRTGQPTSYQNNQNQNDQRGWSGPAPTRIGSFPYQARARPATDVYYGLNGREYQSRNCWRK